MTDSATHISPMQYMHVSPPINRVHQVIRVHSAEMLAKMRVVQVHRLRAIGCTARADHLAAKEAVQR